MADHAPLLVGDVAAHRQRLEINFRRHDRRAEVQQYAAFEGADALGEDEEVVIAGSAQGCAVAIGVLMQDVVADAHVNGDRHAEPGRCRQNAHRLVRKIAGEDHPPERFADAHALVSAGADDIVHDAGFVPQTELAGLNVMGHALGRRADQCELPVVDRSRAVHRDVADQTPLHEIDNET